MGIFTIIRALGYDEINAPGFIDRFVNYFDFLEDQWRREKVIAPTREEALLEIYKRARPSEPQNVEAARVYFEQAFFGVRYNLSRVGLQTKPQTWRRVEEDSRNVRSQSWTRTWQTRFAN
jgi:DNA-directed RNA polymerase subunit beta